MVGNAKKVLVALSGGVDSSVAAALLKERGYDVAGAFIRTWSAPWLPCTWRSERLDAMRVAAHLGIPFYTVDLSHEYEHAVVDYLVREYQAGRTPNPDCMCNKHIKFGAFYSWAREQGFTIVATGHYAQVGTIPIAGDSKEHVYTLSASHDTEKDQSYFLWTIPQDVLAHVLFPVGEYEKHEVRAMAAHFGLPTAEKKDSQGICFLGKVDMADFLKRYVTTSVGVVLNQHGVVVGEHDGALLYTLGERRGFRVHHTSTNDVPLYVVAKDVAANTITVAPREEGMFAVRELELVETHWIGTSSDALKERSNLTARFRYRQPLVGCTVVAAEGCGARVRFSDPQHYVAPGQSLVLYEHERCLGGGVIERTHT